MCVDETSKQHLQEMRPPLPCRANLIDMILNIRHVVAVEVTPRQALILNNQDIALN